MDFTAWAFYAFITAAAIAAVVLHYRRREPPGRGRALLAGLRGVALALLILLLFDPVLPTTAATRGSGTVVLLDASLSMTLPMEEGEGTRWEAGRAVAEGAGGDRILRFGGTTLTTGAPDADPRATTTRLAPAVRAAAESGARRVVVVTDGGVEDAPEALALAERAGLAMDVRVVGESPAPNAGIVAIEAPAWAEVGEEAAVEATVAAVGGVVDSLTLVLRRGERELARARVAAPGPGRLATATLRFTPTAAAAGPVRLDVALAEADAAAADDVRSVYVRIAEEPAGIALVTFRPDQEPRFLLPVLERALGLPARGWMALPAGRYLRLGTGPEAGTAATEADARRAVTEAGLVVLHGLGPETPGWARAAASEAPRVLLFPTTGAVEGLPFAPGPARPGDWYPAPEVPSSPVAPLMAGVEPGDAPPLGALRTPDPPAGWWTPLQARLGRRGEPRPVLLAGTAGERRVVVALGDGYWRWAFAGGPPRALYDRLWAAVGGWLVAESGRVAGEAIRPVERVVARDHPVRFRVQSQADSLRLRLTPAAGAEPALDSTFEVTAGEVVGPVLRPGHYRYEAAVSGAGAGAEAGAPPATGELTVESFSAELTRQAVALEGMTGEEGGRAAGVGGRPLRASAWPYVLLVLLLCTEWILRRRWGLR